MAYYYCYYYYYYYYYFIFHETSQDLPIKRARIISTSKVLIEEKLNGIKYEMYTQSFIKIYP
jgi:hypothetical protein